MVGARKRQLRLDFDNQNAYAILHNNIAILEFFKSYPNHRLYGEWLVPHHVSYETSAYRKFHVFDIEDENHKYIPYETAYIMGFYAGLDMVPFKIINKRTEFNLLELFEIEEYIKFANYLVSPESSPEGIIIKNYNYKNLYGRQTWVKVLHPDFSNHKPKKTKEQKENIILDSTQEFIDLFLTEGLIQKSVNKITVDSIDVKNIMGKIIQLVRYDLIKEYIPDYVYNKNVTIDFKKINAQAAVKTVSFVKQNSLLRNLIGKNHA